MHSEAVQDYLRALYKLDSQYPAGERVTTSQLAERLAVRPASVTAMLQKMAAAEPALVEYHKSRGARLTAEGELAALEIVRNHRLLELYLHEKLGYSWDEVHEEAERLEHAITQEFAGRLSAALGHPTHDPHGHAIPSAELVVDNPPAIPLSRLKPGQTAVVRHVQDEDPASLRYLAAIGIAPGCLLHAVARDVHDGRFYLSVDGGPPVALKPAVTGQIFVDPT
jgi:DtxR family Mn-dependent transcriptional regulator